MALLQAYFPSPKLPESTVSVWAQELEPYEFDDGAEAVRSIGQTGTGGRPVQIADVLNAIHAAHKHRTTLDLTYRGELTEATGIDDRSKAILAAYHAKFTNDKEAAS